MEQSIREQSLEHLQWLYQFCIVEKHSSAGYDHKKWIEMPFEDRKNILAVHDYMKDQGWIKFSRVSMGCPISLQITSAGIDLVEGTANQVSQVPQVNFHIGQNNGVVASQASNFTINNGISASELENLIRANSSSDQERETLLAAVRELRSAIEAGKPVEKGILAGISDSIQKHSWIASPVATLILRYACGLPQ